MNRVLFLMSNIHCFAVISLLVGCQSESGLVESEFRGVWASEGYGWVMDISASKIALYDELDGRCLQSDLFDAMLDTNALPAEFYIENSKLKTELNGIKNPALTWQKMDDLSEACPQGMEARQGDNDYQDDPMRDFNWFAKTFDQHYAFRDIRNIDVDALMREARDTLATNPTQSTLVEIISHIIRQTQDGHVNLFSDNEFEQIANGDMAATIEGYLLQEAVEQNADDVEAYVEEQIARLLAGIRSRLDLENLQSEEGEVLHWTTIPEHNIGYFILEGMEGFGGEDLTVKEQELSLAKTLDKILADFSDVDRIIIDNRINGGGCDQLSALIAERFITSSPAQLSKAYFVDGQFSEQTTMAYHAHERAFAGDVVILNSPFSASAAETFSLMLLAQPNVTFVGERSAGELSDMLFKALPNGMMFSLSNEAYYSHDGQLYEFVGAPVDREIEVFTRAQRESLTDEALDYAIGL